ncbi:SGNH/GDSL hydrolase family protein [Nocardioides okcheonensis]|uniref:SGNH/GDSL hydrolase family protein n=1 Tax=Nocardioides okcheonensis TaxID=2894081 RepID=UPI001E533846|nr:SGNH/GDSL hydrolase family protein [Nocardioides okcheonensis]UFN42719.1 SGNH/GDSL hydrolase family protein [Nocardioides okcheonensis]
MTFHRYVALGDSFTEGVGDPDPSRPNGLRGWADRVAEVLAEQTDDFGYANLAIRGRKLAPIVAEQVDAAIALEPDLVTIHGGGNDVLRPRVDLDALARTYDGAISRLSATGARVVMFTIFDPGGGGIYGPVRGRMAIFNEWVREIADRHGATVVDMWRMRDVEIDGAMDTDRMHLNSSGHAYMAHAVLEAIGVEHGREPVVVEPLPVLARREQWRANAQWTREFLVPWVHRRITGRSSGDTVTPKHPGFSSVR